MSQIDYSSVTGSTQNLVNVWRLYAQYYSQINGGLEESKYYVSASNVPDNVWDILYKNVLKNLDESARSISIASNGNEIEKKNKLAIIEIMTVYSYSVLVETFGNVPYSEALDISNVLARYDDQQEVYTDLLRRLDAAIQQLDITGGSFGKADPFYSGNTANWKKYGASLKLKMGMRIIDVVPEIGAKAVHEAIETGVFASNDDNAIFRYLSTTPNTNLLWRSLVESKQQYFIPAAAIVDTMNKFNDPRRSVYFTDINGKYIGGQYGLAISYYSVSHIGSLFHTPDLPEIIMDYATVEFLLAEAAERSIGNSSTAELHYNNAIRASFSYYGISPASADDYLAQPAVAYGTASGTWKQKIGTQKWIALYDQGFESWTEHRRLDYPVLYAPVDAFVDEVPTRFVYPISEQTLNGANYQSASAAIGGDLLTTKLFWDIY
jgi:hypothetical protein